MDHSDKVSDKIYQLYLTQMQGLSSFRKEYQSVYSTASLDQDDPELKRLTEAIAYCSAHAQAIGQRTIETYHQRLVTQIHPYVVSPLPAKTLLALNTQNVKETFNIEKGSTFQLETEEGHNALFKTCSPMQILPIQYQALTKENSDHNHVVLTLHFEASETMTQAPDEFEIYINADNDFNRTLSLYNAIKNTAFVPEVIFDGELQPRACELDFRDPEYPYGMHPIEACRNMLHFPYAQFFLYIKLTDAPETWRSFKLQFKLNKTAHRYPIHKDSFRPFCTPIINLREEHAKGIWADGLCSRYSIDPPDLGQNLALHSVTGVYQQLDNNTVPMIPTVMKAGINTFSVTEVEGENPCVELNIPEAFQTPRNISIDACWHQPAFSQWLWQKVEVIPFEIDIPGAKWTITEARQLYAPTLLSNQTSPNTLSMFDVLAIYGNHHISGLQLNQLFYVFCEQWAKEFQCIKDEFMGFYATENQHVFEIRLSLADQVKPIADLWLKYFQNMVNIWFDGPACQLKVKLFR